ncbi:TPA: heme lyase CcmF/NrfE family subunit [Candidatus Poribacteria bacterium]|nr:heme lyase CcmF/NrfE family subunit [Candidatus Poribacteria bacterium]
MTAIGNSALVIALFISSYAAAAAVVGARRNQSEWLKSAENSMYTIFGLLTVASIVLLYAFITRDFRVRYVAQYSSRDLPLFYTIAGFWGGNDGSLLLWAWLLTLFGSIVLIQNRHKNQQLMPYVNSALMVTSAFFIVLLIFHSNPFRLFHQGAVPKDGQGLNPLLQNPGMIFHPPMLYLGYVGFTIPFAFAIAALITGNLSPNWIKSTRRWTLFSWINLTAGILFGAQWAYVELGWGGYWAWDPVENASLLPWLVGTAYLHSVMIQERKDMLKVWNIVLILLTFTLVIFGTFLTRSGVIASVHSFGRSSIGYWFLGFIAVILMFSLWLLMVRLDDLRSENRLDSLISRESSFLFNNVILVGMAFAVLWGTIFPIISEAVRGVKISVGTPFFNQVSVPIGLLLLLLTGICPLIAWRRASTSNLKRNFLIPTAIALLGAASLFVMGIRGVYTIISFTLAIFVFCTILSEFIRGTRARHRISSDGYIKSFLGLMRRNQRRYGGYIIHIGVVMIFIAITGSAFNVENETSLKEGESAVIGNYTLKFNGLSVYPTRNKEVAAATLEVWRNGKKIDVITPSKDFYRQQEQTTTEVAIRSTFKEDLYAILAGYDAKEGIVAFRFLVKPLVIWMWIGGIVMGLGAVIVILPERKRQHALKATIPSEAIT